MPKYFLVIDLEATCCNQKTIPPEEMEMIEIGAVMLNSQTWEIEAEFQQFIQPVRHPKLTDFCTELTSITQQDVVTAPLFPNAIAKFQAWKDAFSDHVFCSWGKYDKEQFQQDCRYHQIPYPFDHQHINIKEEFSAYLGVKRRYGMARALEILGLELIGTHHRGIDDARNIAAIYRHMHTQIKPSHW
ncbi:MAG TPA: 3'-5' exonuclease [Nostocaceae cyanobacterium]|nr:3'-5' exonuclease [Nostocaceae cyanobacterium]